MGVIIINTKTINSINKYRPFSATAEHDLLVLLKDGQVSRQAFEEFYERFKDYVLRVCQKCCSSFDNSNQLADDIFQNTFIKVLHKGHTFRTREQPGKTNYSAEIKAWLSRIAKNELINFLRKNPDEKMLSISGRPKSEDLQEIADSNGQENNELVKSPAIEQHILDSGLAVLSEQEKMVLMTYMMYYNAQSPNQHLPDEVIQHLTNKLGVKAGSLRQIKSRALQKIMKIKEASESTK